MNQTFACPEFPSLVSRLCDEGLSADEHRRLESLLNDDVDLRHWYYDFIHLHGELAWAHGESSRCVAAPLEQASGASLSSQAGLCESLPGSVRSVVPAMQSRPAPVLGFLARVSRGIPGGEFTLGSLIVLVVVAAFWGLWHAILHPAQRSHQLASNTGDAPVDAADLPESRSIALVRQSVDAVWAETRRPIVDGTAVGRAESLSIRSGIVELQLRKGATLLVEGPAEWSIEGDNSAWLRAGKLVAKVPPQASGFTLVTPMARIVDLGTEFGVSVGDAGQTDVRVFRGEVVSTLRGAADAQAVRLQAGQSCRLAAGQIIQHDDQITQTDFTRTLSANSGRPRCVSLWKPVRASSVYGDPNSIGETFHAENVVDGRCDDEGGPQAWSFWLAQDKQPAEFTIDLQEDYLIGEIRLQNTHNRQHNDRGTREYRLSTSRDGKDFVTLKQDVLANVAGEKTIPWVTIPVSPPITARYVRFEALSYYGTGAGLSELQVFEAAAEGTSTITQP